MSTPISRCSFLRMALSGTVVALASPRVALAADSPGGLSGRYRYAGGTAQRQALARAIEGVVDQMNLLIRPIARSRISSALDPGGPLDFEFTRDRLEFRTPGMPVLHGRLDGTPVRWKNHEGADIRVRSRLEGRTLHIRYQGDGGDTRCTYQFSHTARVTVHTRIEHEDLPAGLRYDLTYRRA